MPERGGWSVSTLRVSVRTLGFSYPNFFGKCNLTDLLLSQDFQDGGERGMAERGGWRREGDGRLLPPVVNEPHGCSGSFQARSCQPSTSELIPLLLALCVYIERPA
jgi:hypothetical protein